MQVYREDIRALFLAALFLSVTMDEVTAGSAYMGVTMYFVDKFFQRRAVYLTVTKLTEAANATYLTDQLIEAIMSVAGLTREEIQSKLVNISCDGASVLQGCKSGVVTQVRMFSGPFSQVLM